MFTDFYWRKRARRRGIEKAIAPKSDSKLTFLRALCLESFFKNVLPAEGGKHIFEKIRTNSEVKHKCKQKCMLQLAFLKQIRNLVSRASVSCISLGECRAK